MREVVQMAPPGVAWKRLAAFRQRRPRNRPETWFDLRIYVVRDTGIEPGQCTGVVRFFAVYVFCPAQCRLVPV